jgi:hypothetical protein
MENVATTEVGERGVPEAPRQRIKAVESVDVIDGNSHTTEQQQQQATKSSKQQTSPPTSGSNSLPTSPPTSGPTSLPSKNNKFPSYCESMETNLKQLRSRLHSDPQSSALKTL